MSSVRCASPTTISSLRSTSLWGTNIGQDFYVVRLSHQPALELFCVRTLCQPEAADYSERGLPFTGCTILLVLCWRHCWNVTVSIEAAVVRVRNGSSRMRNNYKNIQIILPLSHAVTNIQFFVFAFDTHLRHLSAPQIQLMLILRALRNYKLTLKKSYVRHRGRLWCMFLYTVVFRAELTEPIKSVTLNAERYVVIEM